MQNNAFSLCLLFLFTIFRQKLYREAKGWFKIISIMYNKCSIWRPPIIGNSSILFFSDSHIRWKISLFFLTSMVFTRVFKRKILGKWYCKPTISGHVLYYLSNHQISHEIQTLKNLLHIAYNLGADIFTKQLKLNSKNISQIINNAKIW